MTLPESADIIPVIMLKIVVLPAPFGPISAVILPSGIVKEAPPTATSPPKLFFKSTTSSAAAPETDLAVVTRASRSIASATVKSSGAFLRLNRPAPVPSGINPCGLTIIITTKAPP